MGGLRKGGLWLSLSPFHSDLPDHLQDYYVQGNPGSPCKICIRSELIMLFSQNMIHSSAQILHSKQSQKFLPWPQSPLFIWLPPGSSNSISHRLIPSLLWLSRVFLQDTEHVSASEICTCCSSV